MLKHFYYTLLFVILVLTIVFCTVFIIDSMNNLADSVNYVTDGSLRVIFTDYNGD